MPSFDIVSEVNLQEVDNAIHQARKEIVGRYDFRGSKASLEWDKERDEVVITGEDDYKIETIKNILLGKLHHRGVDIKSLQFDKVEAIGGMLQRQKARFVQGIEREMAKKINKAIKDSGLKVQGQVEGDKVRVSSKSIDALRECMNMIRSQDFEIPLQFTNQRS